jgi:hypothetical protein
LSFSLLCKILNKCIDKLKADQLDAFKLASAPLPALLRDVKIVANNKKAILNTIKQHEDDQWSPIGFGGEKTDDFQTDDGDGEE